MENTKHKQLTFMVDRVTDTYSAEMEKYDNAFYYKKISEEQLELSGQWITNVFLSCLSALTNLILTNTFTPFHIMTAIDEVINQFKETFRIDIYPDAISAATVIINGFAGRVSSSLIKDVSEILDELQEGGNQ